MFWVKIGITGRSAKSRAKWLDKAVPGIPIPIAAMLMPCGYQVEQFLHWVCAPLKCKYYKGDGHTEWFWLPAIIPGLLAIAAGVVFWLAIAIFTAYLIHHAK